MNWIATCTECSWTCRRDDQVAVGDALERHARKEQHHVELRRAQAASP